MKKLSFLLVILVMAITSCNSHTESEAIGSETKLEYPLSIVEIEGHSYIINHCGGIYHNENCNCKTDSI